MLTIKNLLWQGFLKVRPQLKGCLTAIYRYMFDVQLIRMQPCTQRSHLCAPRTAFTALIAYSTTA